MIEASVVLCVDLSVDPRLASFDSTHPPERYLSSSVGGHSKRLPLLAVASSIDRPLIHAEHAFQIRIVAHLEPKRQTELTLFTFLDPIIPIVSHVLNASFDKSEDHWVNLPNDPGEQSEFVPSLSMISLTFETASIHVCIHCF